jgi:glycosyltransferase involved in cell wall biosynthesis
MILHISTSQGGGAGTAARRLHEGLLKKGTDSRFLAAQGVASELRGLEVLPKHYPRFWQRAARKLGLGLTAHDRWDQTRKAICCTNVFTSGIESDLGLMGHDSIQNADLINLHWVAGMLPWVEFFRTNKKPVVWTLHDMNPFMGIFHYETDRQRGSLMARELDDQIRSRKEQFMRGTSGIVVVTPSRWLQRLSASSELFRRFRHEHIPYGIDTTIFKPHPQAFARSIFDLPQGRKLVLVVAERLDDHRKGFDLLREALKVPELERDWDLVAVGDGPLPFENLKYHRLGVINDERLMALVYSAADMTIIASREDNFPNVILESLCCGTPVIGTPAGGIPESIVNGRDGFVAESIKSECLAAAIRAGIACDFNRSLIASCAALQFDQAVQATRYLDLYREL